MPSMSSISRTGFYQDIGLFWVQVRKRSGTVAHVMDNGTVPPTKWYSNSKKLVILFSPLPELWVEELWSKEKEEVPSTSMECSWTQNYYSRQIILWIKPIFTRLLRIGVNYLPRRKKENTFLHSWTIEKWLMWRPKKWKCWHPLWTKHRETWWCRMNKIQSIGKEGSHGPIMWKNFIPISRHSWVILPSSTRWRRRMGEKLHLCVENTFVLESSHKPNHWELFLPAQVQDRSKRFILWKFLTNME